MLMYPQKGAGFANTLIMLCDFFAHHPDGVVHESIKDYELGRWLTLHFPLTDRTDLPVYEPKIYINQFTIQQVHPMIRKLVSPSPELESILKQNEHLVKDINAGVHVRRGASAIDSRVVVQKETDVFANENAMKRFTDIAHTLKPIFLASDSPETKKLFPDAKSLKEKADVTGVPLDAIQESYNRGMAAWRTGHRPGATEQQWGYARVHSLLVCGKTHFTTDADIVRRAKETPSAAAFWKKICPKS
jgi:hypothetical protein